MTMSVAAALERVGITRLAHFTPAQNLFHILADGEIKSSRDLAAESREYFTPTDLERLDKHPDKVCCSFEYPNGYYLAKATKRPQFANYHDWVCLLLEKEIVLTPGTLFSAHNAATGYGVHARSGGEALLSCFASRAGVWDRRQTHHPQASTDLQAEALVPGPVPLSYLRAIVVPSAKAAQQEWGRLRLLGVAANDYQWVVAPTFFDRDELTKRLRYGGVITETVWQPPQDGTS